jgi:regulatory protein
MDRELALKKCRALCARQERCRQELRTKLNDWELPKQDIERVLTQLEKEDFLNEARFAEAFAVGHFRQKGWGRSMIRHALLSKGIAERMVAAALSAIDDGEYGETLKAMVRKRFRMEKEPDPFLREQRVIRYLMGRGWDADAVRKAIAATAER